MPSIFAEVAYSMRVNDKCRIILIPFVYTVLFTRLVRILMYFLVFKYLYERPPKPPTFWNSCTRTLILDTIMKLSGTIGVTQKTMTLDTHVRPILSQTLHPQERWGTHKKPFQPRPFADVIGLVRCSYIYIYKYAMYESYRAHTLSSWPKNVCSCLWPQSCFCCFYI